MIIKFLRISFEIKLFSRLKLNSVEQRIKRFVKLPNHGRPLLLSPLVSFPLDRFCLILNLAREVARHTAAVVNPATAQKLQASTLVRAKDEVLRIIELLAEKMPNAISDLLGEVICFLF